MAAKYAIGAGGDFNADTTWSTTDGGANDTTKPTAADDAYLTSNSGNVTITGTGNVCRSLDCNGYTGTLTHGSGVTLTIGDATAGAGNIALRFVAGMTYTLGSTATSTLRFITTSATVQTINFGGKITANVEYAAAGGSLQYASAHSTNSNATITLTNGTLDTNGQTCSWGFFSSSNSNTRTLTLGASDITITGAGPAWSVTNATNFTLTANTATITLSGSAAVFSGGAAKDYHTVVFTGAGQAQLNTTATFVNLTRTGTAAKTDTLVFQNDISVSGTFTFNGNSATNRLLLFSGTVGTARTITAATVTVTNSDFQDITGAGAGSWDLSAITGNSGDCGGNSGITFTTAADQTWSGTSGGNWSSNAWTTRVPLPQDNALFSGVAFSASQNVTLDMPRLGKNIDFTGCTGSPNLVMSFATAIFGSWTMIAGITKSSAALYTFAGRGTHTITSAGLAFPNGVTIAGPGGTYTLADAFNMDSNQRLNINNGTFNDGGFNVTCDNVSQNVGTAARGVTMSGTWTLTSIGAATVWNFGTTTNLTFSGATATIVLSGVTSGTKTFIGGNLTYGTLTYTVAGSTGELNITGSNSFAQINFSDTNNQRALKFTAATTTTIRNANGFNVQGTSGKVMFVGSITAAGHTLSSANLQSCDYISVSRSTAQGGGSWYAGANSTDGGNNSGWIFTNAPSSGGTGGGSPNMASLQNLLNLRSL